MSAVIFPTFAGTTWGAGWLRITALGKLYDFVNSVHDLWEHSDCGKGVYSATLHLGKAIECTRPIDFDFISSFLALFVYIFNTTTF